MYTECDISGGRWRVQVPLKPNSCKIENPEKPERGTDCCKYLGAMLENQPAI